MATQTPGSTSSKSPQTPSSRGLKWWLLRVVIVAVLAVAGAAGWRQFREFRKHRMVERAREMIAQKDYPQAILSARRALQMNPHDVAVVRMMLGLAESAKTKEALYWHRMLSELEPGNAADQIAWADCALRYNEMAIAEQALGRVDDAGKKTAVFQDAAGRHAQMTNRLPEAEAHFAEAVKLEPDNASYLVRLAATRLQSATPEKAEASRELLEKYTSDPKMREVASRALLNDYFRQKDWDKALQLAKQVQAAPEATFGDRMLYLGLLRRFQNPDFSGYLLTLQEQAAANSDDTATLITWLADNSLVMVAVSWGKTLPTAVVSKMPVPAAIGECYAILHDWEALKTLVTDGNWEYAEFLRLAFLSRIQRENGDLLSAKNTWNAAVSITGGRPDEILMLTRYASKWGWESEVLDVLWVAARGNSNQQPALNALYQSYVASGNTRGLLNVSTRMYEINPKDPIALNNVVLLSLLLNVNVERAQTLADELYRLQPENPGVKSTYAYSLHLRGKTDEGVKMMRTLDEKQLADPSVATYMAAMLVETETPEQAMKYIEIAQAGKILPEELALIKALRESLARRSAEKASPQ